MSPSLKHYLVANSNAIKEAREVIWHFHLNASTGVASVISNIVEYQRKNPCSYVDVIDLYSHASGFDKNKDIIWSNALKFKVIDTFGTLQYIFLFVRNPIRRLARDLSRIYPEKRIIFHFHSAWLTGAYLPLPRLNNVKYIATIHGLADEHKFRKSFFRKRLHSYWARKLIASDITITSVSKNVVGLFKEIFSVNISNVNVVYNGIVLGERIQYCSEEYFVFGFVGQIAEGKGWRIAVEAFRIFQSTAIIKSKLILVGDGEDADKLKNEIKNDVDIIYKGSVNNARLKIIPFLDCLLLPSWSEGMPMVVLEAAAAGVPTISTRVGDLDLLFSDGYNICFSERDAWNFAKSMQNIASGNTLLMGSNSLIIARTLSVRLMALNYAEVYEESFKYHDINTNL